MKNKRLSMSLMRLKKKLDNLVRGRGHVREHYRVNSKMEVEFKGQEEDLTEEDQEVEDVQDN